MLQNSYQGRPYVPGPPSQTLSNGPIPTPVQLPPAQVLVKNNIRVLCVADVRGMQKSWIPLFKSTV